LFGNKRSRVWKENARIFQRYFEARPHLSVWKHWTFADNEIKNAR
jgi:hypothetical protein